MITGKTIALTIGAFVRKLRSLLFNMLSRFVIAFLAKSKHLLISWLQLPSAVILEPKKRKSVTASTFSSSICHEVMGADAISQLCVQSLQTCLTLVDPMDHSPLDFSVHGIFLARILECIAMLCSRGSSLPRDQICISCIAGEFLFLFFFTTEPLEKHKSTILQDFFFKKTAPWNKSHSRLKTIFLMGSEP